MSEFKKDVEYVRVSIGGYYADLLSNQQSKIDQLQKENKEITDWGWKQNDLAKRAIEEKLLLQKKVDILTKSNDFYGSDILVLHLVKRIMSDHTRNDGMYARHEAADNGDFAKQCKKEIEGLK